MRIAVFGDSIARGAGDKDKNGWVMRLRLFCDNNCDDIDIYNRSISGDTTIRLLKRVRNECNSINPEIILFAMGINDSRYTKTKDDYNVTPKQFKKNIIKLIKIAKRFADKVILLEITDIEEAKVTPIPWHDTEYYYTKNVEEFNKIIHEAARERY